MPDINRCRAMASQTDLACMSPKQQNERRRYRRRRSRRMSCATPALCISWKRQGISERYRSGWVTARSKQLKCIFASIRPRSLISCMLQRRPRSEKDRSQVYLTASLVCCQMFTRGQSREASRRQCDALGARDYVELADDENISIQRVKPSAPHNRGLNTNQLM